MSRENKNKATSMPNNGFIPPQNVDMEQAVLGCVLLESSSIHRVLDIIQPDTFYVPIHTEIWNAILELVKKSLPIDTVTTMNMLRSMTGLGPDHYRETLMKLTNNITSSVHIDKYARIIEEKAIARRTIMVSTEMIHRLYMDEEDINEILAEGDVSLFLAKKALISGNNPDINYVIGEAREQIQKSRSTGVAGVPFCLEELDQMSGGMRGGRVYTFAARTRMGKTAVAAYFQYRAAEAGYASVFFTMEMGRVEFVFRLVSLRCRDMGAHISYSQIDRGVGLTEEQYEVIEEAMVYIESKLAKLIIIDDTTYLSPLTLRSKVLKYISDYGIKSAWMDYIQIANLTTAGKNTTADQISDYMTQVKSISKTLDIAMCPLSQVDRTTEKNGQGGRAKLSDGKGSGAIEEASDMVISIWRPEVNDPDPIDEFGVSEKGVMYIDVLKNKMGGTGLIKKRFDVATNYFETENPYDSEYMAQSPNYHNSVYSTDIPDKEWEPGF